MKSAGSLAALCLLAGPAVAQDLLFQAEAQVLSGTCTGQAVRLEGNHDTLALSGPCGSLLLKGVANTVRLAIVPGGSIRVEGSGNRVAFSAGPGAPPTVVALGPDNDVAAAGPTIPTPPAPKPAPPPPIPPAAPSAAAAPPTQAAHPAPTGPLTLAGDDQQRLADCAGRDVTVTGARSAYVIRGFCRSLTLRGDLLTVQAEVASGARIGVTGQGSIVSWAVQGRGHAPAATVRGAGSRVQRADSLGGQPAR